jgi:hypothetical protein
MGEVRDSSPRGNLLYDYYRLKPNPLDLHPVREPRARPATPSPVLRPRERRWLAFDRILLRPSPTRCVTAASLARNQLVASPTSRTAGVGRCLSRREHPSLSADS